MLYTIACKFNVTALLCYQFSCELSRYLYSGKLKNNSCHRLKLFQVGLKGIRMLYRLAIVEDNATARGNLRSHILPLGQFEISSFSNGTELKSALKKQNFEVILMDFHLGQNKSGVEWIQELRQSRFIKPSTGIIFITSDRLPQTIGQIIDIHPDMLIIKPYTIATITRSLSHYLNFREYVAPALHSLDNDDPKEALAKLNSIMRRSIPPKIQTDVQKLKARLLLVAGQIKLAKRLYETVLEKSDKVLWAQWGKIKCQYLDGTWHDCADQLRSMVQTSLAKDKAFEWLAGLSFERQDWQQAEYYLNHIKTGDLSLQATKLKSLTYQKLDRVVDGIELLQHKREINRSAKDRFTEFTFELAEFYLSIAEHQPLSNRPESALQAKRLVGIAGRNQGDQQLIQKRDFILAYTALLEGDEDKARHYVEGDNMQTFVRTDPPTLLTAAKVYHGLGEHDLAKSLVAMAHDRNKTLISIAEQVSNNDALFMSEINMGLAQERATEANEQGTRLFVEKKYTQAMDSFYLAFQLMPDTAAFPLNLLQCMVEAKQAVFKRCSVSDLIQAINEIGKLNSANKKRFEQLQSAVTKQPALFLNEAFKLEDLSSPPSERH